MESDSEASFGGFDLDDVGSIHDNFDNFESDVDVSSTSSVDTEINVDESDVFPSDIDADRFSASKKWSATKRGSELVSHDSVASHRLVRFSGHKRPFLFHFTTPIETGALSWWGGLCLNDPESYAGGSLHSWQVLPCQMGQWIESRRKSVS